MLISDTVFNYARTADGKNNSSNQYTSPRLAMWEEADTFASEKSSTIKKTLWRKNFFTNIFSFFKSNADLKNGYEEEIDLEDLSRFASKKNIELLQSSSEFLKMINSKLLSPLFVKSCLFMDDARLSLLTELFNARTHKYFVNKAIHSNKDKTYDFTFGLLSIKRMNEDDLRNMIKNANNPRLLNFVKNNNLDYDTFLDFIKSDNLNRILSFTDNEKIKKLLDNPNFPQNYLKMFANFDDEEPGLFLKLISNDAMFSVINKHKIKSYQITEILKSPRAFFPILNPKALEYQRKKVKERPELYVSGTYTSTPELIESVDNFFKYNYVNLLMLSSIYDKNTINNILRLRFDKVENILTTFDNLDNNYKALLPLLVKTKDMNDSEFTSSQKIDFINLLSAYQSVNSPNNQSVLLHAVKSGKVNLDKLKKEVFLSTLEKFNIKPENLINVDEKKLSGWDFDFVHHLAKTSYNFADVIRAAILEPDFLLYILSNSSEYGKPNLKTRIAFEKHNLDYDKWLKPSSENNVRLVLNNLPEDIASNVSRHICDDMRFLRSIPSAKSYIDRHFPTNIDEMDEFFIPDDIAKSKIKLHNFIKNLLVQLQSLNKRAIEHIQNNPENKSARNTIEIFKGFERSLLLLENHNTKNLAENLDCTVRMWQRNPQRDLFQGNYSTCCIGLGENNEDSIVSYLSSTAFNMIEFVDNHTGKPFGNALCYFVSTHDDKKVLLLDNIEINNAFKITPQAKNKLRDAIELYAKNMAKEVTGNANPQVYLGLSCNDVDTDDLKEIEENISIIGANSSVESYIDVLSGWTSEYFGRCKLLKFS